MKKELKEIIYLPDYLRVLCMFYENKNSSVNELHYLYKISYPSLHNMKNIFINKGWVTVYKDLNKHIVVITPKGQAVVGAIYNLVAHLEMNKEDLLNLKKLNRIHKVKPNEKENEDNIESTNPSEAIKHIEIATESNQNIEQ